MIILESKFTLPQTLQYNENLNPALFDHYGEIKPDVRNALLRVADNFIETLAPAIDKSMVENVFLTGSNANYNYTSGSDCDLHIMIRFPSEIYEDYALAKKTVWNTQFHVSIHGFPVEVYPQNVNEEQVDGSGWYNLTTNQWAQKPVHQDNVDVNNPSIKKVAEKIGKEIDFSIKYNVKDLNTLHRLGTKIWGLRDQAKNGEFSVNNLAFKQLRNSGWTDKYIKYMQGIQDKELSIDAVTT